MSPAHPGTVLVDARSAPAGAAARCAERLLGALPRGTALIVFTPRNTRLAPALARRVRSVRGGQEDYRACLAQEVSRDRAVVVVPGTSVLTGAVWFAEANARMAAEPASIGVVGRGDAELLAFPRQVVDVDGPRTPWSPLPGLDVRAGVAEGVSTDRPRTISAVLIVKDEANVLEACLRAVTPFVDEVVVYDTGSTDRSLEIAHELADVVIEGFWDDDFGAARNRALCHATGDWVLSIDADEVIEGDCDGLRRVVDSTTSEGLLLSIVSTAHGRGRSGGTTRATRLFRRSGATWTGVLHEQLAFDEGRRPAFVSTEELPVSAVHSGYSATTMAEKDKRQRNVDLSLAALDAATPGTAAHSDGAAHHGRALAGAGRVEEAVHVFGALLRTPAKPGNCVQAARIVVPELLSRRAWVHLERWLELAARSGESAGQLAVWRAGVLIGHQELDAAASLLDELIADSAPSTDMWGHRFDVDDALTMRAELDLLKGAPQQAASRMRDLLHRTPETVNLQVLVNAFGAMGMTMRDLIDEAPEAFLERALRDVVLLSPRISLHWFAAHTAARPGDFRPLVGGSTVAARVGWVEALEWSVRSHEAGIPGVCALRDLAEDPQMPALDRALCWALLAEGYQEESALDGLAAVLLPLTPEADRAVRRALQEQVPGVLTRLAAEPASARTLG